MSFTSEEEAWEAYEEAKDEGNIRILPGGAKSQSSRSPRKGSSTSRNDEHRPSTSNPKPSEGCGTNSGKTVSNSTAVTSPETVTLVGGNSSSRPLSRERAPSKPAAAPHLPPGRSSSSRGAPPSPVPPTKSTNIDEFVRLYVASSSKRKSQSAPSSTSRKGGLDRNSPKPVLPRARRVIVREPSFLRPYPDEPESSDDEQPGAVSSADLLSPLTSPRLQTPELYEGPLSPPSQNQQPDRHSPASIMSAMGLAPSQVTGGPSYDAVADLRSPLAKTAPIPRDTNRSVSCILVRTNIFL